MSSQVTRKKFGEMSFEDYLHQLFLKTAFQFILFKKNLKVKHLNAF